MNKTVNTGATFGAIDPNSEEAIKHAELYYEEIRNNNNSDVEKIAELLDKSEGQILMIKNYLFNDKHLLDGRFVRFDAEIHIAQSWQRLAFMQDKVLPHDKILIEHELMEMDLVNRGISQQEAHNITNMRYNYTEACNKYDAEMGFITSYTPIQSGAITQIGFNTH